MTDVPRPTIAEQGGCVYVTLAAAKHYREWAGYDEHETEAARRELTDLMLDARESATEPGRYRSRSRRTGIDLSALVAREGRLYVVTDVWGRETYRGDRSRR